MKDKTKLEIQRWLNAATMAAFTALALFVSAYWIGTETWIQCVAILITTTAIVTGVLWWYWAIKQIANFSKYMSGIGDSVKELKDDLKDIRKDM